MAILTEKPLQVAENHYLLKIKMSGYSGAFPGQFINISPGENFSPLLRRPFSVFNSGNDGLEIIVKQVGAGTKKISMMEAGPIDVIGPLGKGFSIPADRNVLIAGGGVGNAPLYFLALELKKAGNRVSFIYGARSEEYVFMEKKFRETSDNFILCTDNGSSGLKSGAAEALSMELERGDEAFDIIYTCGPAPMMKSVYDRSGGIPVEISVENYFGCGIGVCSGCTVETSRGREKACQHGPVFRADEIDWNSIVK